MASHIWNTKRSNKKTIKRYRLVIKKVREVRNDLTDEEIGGVSLYILERFTQDRWPFHSSFVHRDSDSKSDIQSLSNAVSWIACHIKKSTMDKYVILHHVWMHNNDCIRRIWKM